MPHAILIFLAMSKFRISRCAILAFALVGLFVSGMWAQADER
jgi:hypothetical protein